MHTDQSENGQVQSKIELHQCTLKLNRARLDQCMELLYSSLHGSSPGAVLLIPLAWHWAIFSPPTTHSP